ncbi:hypothetical protein [Tumebacillus algifaecis]|uniref:hypothetical protein n=1 Tax=Tumebacillus algifaecis TaxID=1214604 RepID=UPI0012FDB9B9|nr:hypothetical protein [Tumebacillus algifaecis]
MNNHDNRETVQVTPEEMVNDYLIGEHELEKLKHGFQAPLADGQPCAPVDSHADAT